MGAPVPPPAGTPAPPLSAEQITTIKATIPFLQQYGTALTTRFYRTMLDAHPDLRNVFSATDQATGAQPRALAASLFAYASHIDNLPALLGAVEHIAHKHVSLHIVPEQYAIVRQHLLETLALMLGELGVDGADAIVATWAAAYDVLADVLIAREGELYKGGEWVGWRKLRVLRRVPETDAITSFYLAASGSGGDDAALPSFLPGQYISVRIFVPSLGRLQTRQYSLSAPPRAAGDYYRISVKREEGEDAGIPGMVSNLLHATLQAGDEIEVSRPQGDFYLDPRDAATEGAPAVLISAGIGATPMMAILGALVPSAAAETEGDETETKTKTAAPAPVSRPVSWIQSARTTAALPFRVAVRRSGVASRVFVRDVVAATDKADGVDYDFGGARMDLARLDGVRDLHLGDARAEYYVCGPEAFMREIRRALVGMGVAKGRVHLEVFGTGVVDDEE